MSFFWIRMKRRKKNGSKGFSPETLFSINRWHGVQKKESPGPILERIFSGNLRYTDIQALLVAALGNVTY